MRIPGERVTRVRWIHTDRLSWPSRSKPSSRSMARANIATKPKPCNGCAKSSSAPNAAMWRGFNSTANVDEAVDHA